MSSTCLSPDLIWIAVACAPAVGGDALQGQGPEGPLVARDGHRGDGAARRGDDDVRRVAGGADDVHAVAVSTDDRAGVGAGLDEDRAEALRGVVGVVGKEARAGRHEAPVASTCPRTAWIGSWRRPIRRPRPRSRP